MAGKSKSNKKSPGTRQRLTLDDITVTWTDLGGERSATGTVLAWLLTRAAHLTGNPNLQTFDVAEATGPSLLRGLAEIQYPDAGGPAAYIDKDRRWFLNWVLDELAAQQHADQVIDKDAAGRFTVTVGGK
jgi:hypothetical protein